MDKKTKIMLSIAALVVVLDQFTKFLVKNNLQLGDSIPLIKNIFHLTYVTNTGSAFGLFKNLNVFFVIFSIIVIFVIFYYLRQIKKKERLVIYSIGLLLGGTIGNLIDRIAYGAVIDFIDFKIWPVFNVADSAVTISIVMLIILLWKK